MKSLFQLVWIFLMAYALSGLFGKMEELNAVLSEAAR